MIKIKALVDTIAKKQPKQSSDDLPESEKHYVDKGRIYQVNEIKTTTNNHWFVTLSYGAGDWYFYKAHVKIFKSTSQTGIDLIKRFEGLRLKAYQDSVGVWTIGYGHTKDVTSDLTINETEAEELLKKDIETFEETINEVVTVPLSQNQFDALVSFTFNVGSNAFKKSSLLETLNNNNYGEAQKEFYRWVYAGTQKLSGLIERREAEAELFGSDIDNQEEEKPKKQIDAGNGYSTNTINWNDFDSPVSKYFTVGEVTQWDSQRIPTSSEIQNNILQLAKELDTIREKWGSPVQVTSWYRPPNVNRAVGGAKHSQHLTGKAVDIYPSEGSILEFQNWLDNGIWKDRALGYGAKRGFVHCDTRSGRIRWNY